MALARAADAEPSARQRDSMAMSASESMERPGMSIKFWQRVKLSGMSIEAGMGQLK